MKNEPHRSHKTIGFLRRGYSSSGGAEAYLKRLAEGLRQQNYRVVLLGTGEWPAEKWPGGEVVTLPQKKLRDFGAAALRWKQEKKIDLLFSLERVPGCDFFRAGDGVHAAWLARQSVVEPWWSHLMKQWIPKHRQILKFERELFSSRSKTKIIANSEMVAQEIRDYFDVPSSSINVIYNGVPFCKLVTPKERAVLRKKWEIEDKEFVVLFVGSGWKRKGLKTALQAVEKVASNNSQNKTRLWVAGKGNQKRYQSSVVRFLGPLKNLTEVYGIADLFILPTLYDPFSNASLEALASGLPVITSAANGCSEILEDEIHGSIIGDSRNVERFAAALHRWQERLQDHNSAEKIRHACAARGRKFSIEKNVQATLQLIEEELCRLL